MHSCTCSLYISMVWEEVIGGFIIQVGETSFMCVTSFICATILDYAGHLLQQLPCTHMKSHT